MRLPGPDGRLMHASVRIGDSIVMLVDEMPEWGALGPKALKGSPVTIHLMVDDVDAVFAQAVAAGATVKMPVADMFWGDRYGQVDRSLRPCLVDRDAYARPDAGRDRGGGPRGDGEGLRRGDGVRNGRPRPSRRVLRTLLRMRKPFTRSTS